MPRRLTPTEITKLLNGDYIARLATVDRAGYPHVTPLWFLWERDTFYLASDAGRPHLARIRANPRVGLVIDTEDPERLDGERPNRQVRVIGDATLVPDTDGAWTTRIWSKYRTGHPDPAAVAERLKGRNRILISIQPWHFVAIASV